MAENSSTEDQSLSAAKCDELTERFAEITGADVMLAHYFLQEAEWNLEAAVNEFYRNPEPEKTENAVAYLRPLVTNSSESSQDQSSSKFDSFKFLTWNVDGLDPHNRASRTKAAIKIIQTLSPDVICLQEVVGSTYQLFENELSPIYTFHSGVNSALEDSYFCCILLKASVVRCTKQIITKFPGTGMGRHIVTCQVNLPDDTKVSLMCTHLESCKEFAAERKIQLRKCFEIMQNFAQSTAVVLAGDLNIRDTEIKEIGGVPTDIQDAWILCDSPKDSQFTWDTQLNDNHSFDSAEEGQGSAKKWKPRCRFDRIFVCGQQSGKTTGLMLKPITFELVGKEKIRSALCFPSDHFGILTTFKVKKTA